MKKIFLITITMTILFSCKHDIENPTWDVGMIFPIAHAKLNIDNIISDTATLVNTDDEGFISIVYQQKFVDLNFDTLIKIDAIADEQTHTLDSARFADVIISDTATIGEAISEVPLGSILLPNGSTNSIPALPGIANADTIDIDASQYFETMTLYKGLLIISLNNGYPTDISNISLTLINATNQNIIATFFFPVIPSGSIVSDTVSIGGQTIDENIFAILDNMDINASNGPVLINYSDAIITTITISDIGITEATAIFPEQQLTETLKEHSFDLGNVEINEIGIKEGTVKINVLSTLPNGKMVYEIPSLTKNGIPFKSGDMIIPEAINTELTTFTFDFSDYVLDLTGKEGRSGGDTINTIYTESYTYIDYTGTLETINHTDSFYSFVEFDLTPEYAKGYMGQDTLLIGPEIIPTDIFDIIQSGSINLESANMNIGINNYIGVDAAIKINHLSTLNENDEIMAPLDNNTIYNIERANITNNNTITPSYTEINIQADEMLEILPNQINTSATFYTNPNNIGTTEDFLYPEYPLEANMNIEIPLSIIANNLSFMDTTTINLPDNNEFEIEKIYMTINNGLPFDAEIQILLLDENDLLLDTLIDNKNITSAQVNANNIVVNSTSTTIEMDYKSFESVKKMVATSTFTTKPINQFINIYSNYEIDITLSVKTKKTMGE